MLELLRNQIEELTMDQQDQITTYKSSVSHI
jgi:hypothetical protein